MLDSYQCDSQGVQLVYRITILVLCAEHRSLRLARQRVKYIKSKRSPRITVKTFSRPCGKGHITFAHTIATKRARSVPLSHWDRWTRCWAPRRTAYSPGERGWKFHAGYRCRQFDGKAVATSGYSPNAGTQRAFISLWGTCMTKPIKFDCLFYPGFITQH